jgi:hypothetical protein
MALRFFWGFFQFPKGQSLAPGIRSVEAAFARRGDYTIFLRTKRKDWKGRRFKGKGPAGKRPPPQKTSAIHAGCALFVGFPQAA